MTPETLDATPPPVVVVAQPSPGQPERRPARRRAALRRVRFLRARLVAHVTARWRFVSAVAVLACAALVIGEGGELARYVARMRFTLRLATQNIASAGLLGGMRFPARSPAPLAPPGSRACSPDMALVERDGTRVCVDRWEASLVEVADSGAERAWSPYLPVPTDGRAVKAVSRPGVVPQGYISRDEAEQACNAADKRLCAADEWTAACRGPEATTYPYGDQESPEACNTHGKSPLGELFNGYGDLLWNRALMNDPSLNALEGTVAPTGSFAQCTNRFGVYDMVGNLHEWTAEPSGAFHGGYYLDTQQNGAGCGYVTRAHYPTYHDYSTGFRCCRDPR